MAEGEFDTEASGVCVAAVGLTLPPLRALVIAVRLLLSGAVRDEECVPTVASDDNVRLKVCVLLELRAVNVTSSELLALCVWDTEPTSTDNDLDEDFNVEGDALRDGVSSNELLAVSLSAEIVLVPLGALEDELLAEKENISDRVANVEVRDTDGDLVTEGAFEPESDAESDVCCEGVGVFDGGSGRVRVSIVDTLMDIAPVIVELNDVDFKEGVHSFEWVGVSEAVGQPEAVLPDGDVDTVDELLPDDDLLGV